MNTIQSQAFGGQILTAQLLGTSIFYCPETIVPPPTPTRGGVPVLFPQFATRGNLIKHGFARIHDWQMFTMLDDCVSASLLLTEQTDWPHRAQLNLDANIQDERLEIFLEIRNVGDSDLTWTGGLHPYFAVGDVTQTRVEGLSLNMSEHDVAQLEYNSSFAASPYVDIHSPHTHLRISQTGFDSWMVWNPGGQRTLGDIPHKDWQKFLCVEPVNLSPKNLRAGEEWFGSMTIDLLEY